MKITRLLSAAAGTAMLVGAFALPGTGVAYAATTDDGPLTSLLSGNALTAPISAPINLCGVSVGALLGGANSGCVGGASSNVTEVGGLRGSGGGDGGDGGDGGLSVGSGNNVNAPVSVPVNVCGVAAGVAGGANAHCLGGASSNVTQISGRGDRGGRGGGFGDGGGSGEPGGTSILSGNNVNAPVSVPVDVCGVAIALLGEANAECIGGATTNVTDFPTRAGGGNTPGGTSILSGNNVNTPVSVPVNVCGVSIAVLGAANSSCVGGASVNPPVCHGDRCGPPVCHGDRCTPPVCHGDRCTPPVCQGTHCGPPNCQGGCTPPGGNPPGGNPPGTNPGGGVLPGGGTQGGGIPGGGTVASVTSSLPTTGANLLALLVAAVAFIGVGAGTIVVARRRRTGEIA